MAGYGSARHGIAGEHFKKISEKMQINACEPLRVTLEAVDAYEQQSGFHGIGKIMVERGCWVIVPKEGVGTLRWNSRNDPGALHGSPGAPYRERALAISANTGSGVFQ